MKRTTIVVLLAVTAACAEPAPGPEPQFPSPMEETVRAHDRVEPGERAGRTIAVRGVLPSDAVVFVPDSVGAEPDLLVHFHGPAYLVQDAVSRARPRMVGVSVNLGSGSSVYERPFDGTGVFAALLDSVRTHVSIRRFYLSSWSAGYGAVRAILRQDADRIEGVLLLDGLHTDYRPSGVRMADGGTLDGSRMEPFRVFARAAADGARRMIVTHSEIFPGTYASTTETAAWLADTLGLDRSAVLRWGPGGMQQLSEAGKGRFTILGFAGNTAPDHVDHAHALHFFLGRLTDR